MMIMMLLASYVVRQTRGSRVGGLVMSMMSMMLLQGIAGNKNRTNLGSRLSFLANCIQTMLKLR
jgi:hypothetical protein